MRSKIERASKQGRLDGSLDVRPRRREVSHLRRAKLCMISDRSNTFYQWTNRRVFTLFGVSCGRDSFHNFFGSKPMVFCHSHERFHERLTKVKRDFRREAFALFLSARSYETWFPFVSRHDRNDVSNESVNARGSASQNKAGRWRITMLGMLFNCSTIRKTVKSLA